MNPREREGGLVGKAANRKEDKDVSDCFQSKR